MFGCWQSANRGAAAAPLRRTCGHAAAQPQMEEHREPWKVAEDRAQTVKTAKFGTRFQGEEFVGGDNVARYVGICHVRAAQVAREQQAHERDGGCGSQGAPGDKNITGGLRICAGGGWRCVIVLRTL